MKALESTGYFRKIVAPGKVTLPEVLIQRLKIGSKDVLQIDYAGSAIRLVRQITPKKDIIFDLPCFQQLKDGWFYIPSALRHFFYLSIGEMVEFLIQDEALYIVPEFPRCMNCGNPSLSELLVLQSPEEYPPLVLCCYCRDESLPLYHVVDEDINILTTHANRTMNAVCISCGESDGQVLKAYPKNGKRPIIPLCQSCEDKLSPATQHFVNLGGPKHFKGFYILNQMDKEPDVTKIYYLIEVLSRINKIYYGNGFYVYFNAGLNVYRWYYDHANLSEDDLYYALLISLLQKPQQEWFRIKRRQSNSSNIRVLIRPVDTNAFTDLADAKILTITAETGWGAYTITERGIGEILGDNMPDNIQETLLKQINNEEIREFPFQ